MDIQIEAGPVLKGQSNRDIVYQCSDCGAIKDRSEMSAKMVSFTTIGKPFRRIKTRTIKWLCKTCMESDSDFQREKLQDSPGLADVRRKKEASATTSPE